MGNINEGGFAIISKIKKRQDQKMFAMKMVTVGRGAVFTPESNERWTREVFLTSWINHPNILKCYYHGSLEQSRYDDRFLVCDLMFCDLKKFIKHDNLYRRSKVVNIAYQISIGLNFLHEHSIAHRDIKPRNILISDTSSIENVKLADFGSCNLINDQEYCLVGLLRFHRLLSHQTEKYIYKRILFQLVSNSLLNK